jgi:hypothetical protein
MDSATRLQTETAARALWLCFLVVVGVGSGIMFACVTPFAAIATLAALKMGRLEGLAVVIVVWLANQAIGFGLLGYPWTLNCLAWGLAIGVSSLLGFGAAGALSSPRPVRLAVSLPFIAAFAVYELGLYVAGLSLGAEQGAFSFAVVKQVFLINLVALLIPQALSGLARGFGLFGGPVPPSGLAAASR